MLAIAVLAFISTLAFYKKAKSNRLHPGKAASIPFVLAGIRFAVAYLIAMLFLQWENPFGATDRAIENVLWMADVFLVLTYFCAISKYWKSIVDGKPRS